MIKTKYLLTNFLIYFFCLLPLLSQAQFSFNKNFSPVVVHASDTLTMAWMGGLNNPQFSNIDFDLDGDNDIFIFDRSGDVKLAFKVQNTGTETLYIPLLDELSDFPDLSAWTLLLDYNQDGKTDIFSHSDSIPGGGISVFKNIGSAGSPAFELIDGLFETHAEYEDVSFTAPLYVNLADIPSFIDLDEDGDIDVLTFSINGSELEYHENQSQELYGDNEHFVFELKNACWGYFKENSLNNNINLYDSCTTNVLFPKSNADETGLHVGSTVLSIDLDGNEVKDLLVGDISGSNIVSLINGGDLQSGIMVSFDPNFPENTVPVNMQVFPSPFYTDVNNDAIKDLVIAPNAPNTANNFSSTWLYSNSGTNEAPVFNWEEFAFMQDEMIDRGSNALPVFFDYNADGKLDLVIANKSFYDNNSDQISKLALYENTGTSGQLSFELVDDDYLNLNNLGLSLALFPSFGDMDNDGDEDLILGDLNGVLHYFENTAGPGNVADFNLSIPGMTDQNGSVIDVGQFATPFIVDINRDGINDLVIGERNGNLNYYQNTGSAEAFQFALQNESFGEVLMPGDLNEGFSVPFIIDMEDGYHLFVGSNNGEVVHFYPIEDDLNGTFPTLNSNILSFYEGKRSGIAMADLDGNEGLEMIVGNYRGGLGFYQQADPNDISERELDQSPFSLYPNPANARIEIKIENEFLYNFEIMNSLGEVLLSAYNKYGNQNVNVESLAPGMYFLRFYNADLQFTHRLIIAK